MRLRWDLMLLPSPLSGLTCDDDDFEIVLALFLMGATMALGFSAEPADEPATLFRFSLRSSRVLTPPPGDLRSDGCCDFLSLLDCWLESPF